VVNGQSDPGLDPSDSRGSAVGASAADAAANAGREAPAKEGQGPLADGRANRPPAGDAPAGEDNDPPDNAGGEAGRNAAAAAGDEYAERSRAGVTGVYIYDNRSYGVYAEGTISARDISGRDKIATVGAGVGAGRQAARTVSVVAIASQDRDKLRRVAVSTGRRERAAAILQRERLVILHGPAGVGKATAGVWLMGFDNEVLRADPSLSARDLADFRQRFPQGGKRRYLVETLPPATARQLTGFVMRAAARDLESVDGYLVITVDEHIPLSPELAGYVVDWPDRPDTALALRAHLAYYLGNAEASAVEDRYDLAQLHAGLAGRAVRSIDEVARAVVSAFRASRPLDVLLGELGFDAAARVARWFAAEERRPEDIGLLLAVTVLGGCPYSTVARHARHLELLIADASRIRLSKLPANPLRTRSQRLRNVMAVLEPGFVETEYGQSPAELVRLENRWLVQAVLSTVWHEYDLLSGPLLAWLREAGDDPDPGVRLRAAAAAGWLSQYDFAALRQQLFLPWARGSSEAAWAAADALGQAAWFDSTAPLALALLDVWAWQDDDYDLWWTAAVAYGGETGVRHQGVAMDQLLAIAGKDDLRARDVIARSVARLVTSGGRYAPPVAALVFAHLISWLEYSSAAASAARQAYAILLYRASDPDWPSSREYWQLLTAPRNQASSARLLRAVLGERSLRMQALESLRVLVRACDHDQGIRKDLTALLTPVAGSSANDRDRLVHYLNRWADGSEPSPAARDLASLLKEVIVS
jgi:hypothetical protein